MEEINGTKLYIDLLKKELSKQREVYLALNEGFREDVC